MFLVMTIAPLTLQMVTEVRREEKGRSWSEWGRRPRKDTSRRSSRFMALSSHKARLRDRWRL